jgi:hypothetical protein
MYSRTTSGRAPWSFLAELGGTVVTGTPADFHRLIVAETAKWGKVVKFAGIKAE